MSRFNNNADDSSQEHPTRRLNDLRDTAQPNQDTRRLTEAPKIDAPGPDPHEPGKAQAKTLICSECGGDMVWASTEAVSARPLRVYAFRRNAWGAYNSSVVALVCIDCGFTKLYTEQPRNLLR